MSDTTPPADTAIAIAEPAHPATCENCGTPLQGEFCHHCGQSAHDPTKHLGHAIEEVFESFWHLDGRIFRTLRELFVPGRVARDYLAGHRVRYIPPLRLFVILSLLTFFVGRMVLHVEPNISVGGDPVSFAGDRNIADVERHRARLLADLAKREAEAANTPGVSPILVATRARIQGQAAARIAELRKHAGDAGAGKAEEDIARPAPADSDATPPTTATATGAPTHAAATATAKEGDDRQTDCKALVAQSRQASWVPDFASRWVKERLRRGCQNFQHVDTEGGRLLQAFLAAVPTALFVLMPVFALLLKLVYLGSGRSYLEHLVVALYSHAFLLLMLLALFLLSALGNAGAPGWLTGLGYAAVWIWMPIYLWKMQRRVYGGGWLSNSVRYLIIGCIYFTLMLMATVYAAAMGISS